MADIAVNTADLSKKGNLGDIEIRPVGVQTYEEDGDVTCTIEGPS